MRLQPLALLLMLAASGCTTGALLARTAQTVLEPYSFYVEGHANGMLGVNSRYIAIDAEVSVKMQYRGPEGDVLGAPIVVRWEQEVARGPGRRAYAAVFGLNGKFVEVRPVSWEEARQSMPWLPAETIP
jgi:hypothetical protein